MLPQLQPEFGDYPFMFEGILSAAASLDPPLNIEFVIYDVVALQYPADPFECDAYVITGSKYSVYDDEPWIHGLRDYVVTLAAAKIKLIGICFGHQMIALALGGHTEAADSGWGVGIHESRLLAHEDFMRPNLSSYRTIVSHKDQVSKLPDGAVLLAESEFCPYSMYRIGEHIFALQGHIEFCPDYSRALMTFRRELIGEAVYGEGIESLEQTDDRLLLARWILNFISS